MEPCHKCACRHTHSQTSWPLKAATVSSMLGKSWSIFIPHTCSMYGYVCVTEWEGCDVCFML